MIFNWQSAWKMRSGRYLRRMVKKKGLGGTQAKDIEKWHVFQSGM